MFRAPLAHTQSHAAAVAMTTARAPIKVAVVLGAGASHDAWNSAGPPVDLAWKPPLARELFGTRPAFWEVLRLYRGAALLASELGELAAGDTFNIEAKLREFANHSDPRVVEHFKEVPPYLRHLIVRVVAGYTGTFNPGTHLRFVLNLLGHGVQVACIDLNYDPYIEMALAHFDDNLIIRGMDDYVSPGRQAILCKVHGSIDWGTPLPQTGASWRDTLRLFDPTKRGETIFCPSRRDETHFMSHDQKLLYPVLTAPLAGKGHTDLVCPESHLDALRSFLGDCERFIFIGTSGQDEDVLALLHESVRTVEMIDYVTNSEASAREVYGRVLKACPVFSGTNRVGFFGDGFRHYAGEPLVKFLTAR